VPLFTLFSCLSYRLVRLIESLPFQNTWEHVVKANRSGDISTSSKGRDSTSVLKSE
jgi:hypothetical protein